MDEQDVGRNIRRIREEAGLTVTAAAALAGLTKSALSKIEKGQISAPISTLVRIAGALQAELAAFFVNPGPRPAYALTRRGQGAILTRDGSRFGYAYEALALDMPGKRAEPFMLTILPGDPPGDFAHDGQEFIHMIAGSLHFTVGDETITLRKGDSLYFDATVPHRTQVAGNQPARFLCMFIDDAGGTVGGPASRPTRRGRPAQAPSQHATKPAVKSAKSTTKSTAKSDVKPVTKTQARRPASPRKSTARPRQAADKPR